MNSGMGQDLAERETSDLNKLQLELSIQIVATIYWLADTTYLFIWFTGKSSTVHPQLSKP